MEDQIRAVITRYAKLSIDVESIPRDADLYQAGMTSHASVSLMLGLENEFDIEFPDEMLKRSVFESVASISNAVSELIAADAAA